MAMRERPILMTPENAQKCHDGTKTQTRRIVKPQPKVVHGFAGGWLQTNQIFRNDAPGLRCPYGVVGDRLWVREAWAWPGEESFLYKGIPADARLASEWQKDPNCCQLKWMPSIHMPRMACRTVLEITNIRVERLQEISEEDARAEGIQEVGIGAVHDFMLLWESINGAGSWGLNPWVWVIAFRKVGGMREMTREQVVQLIRRGVRDAGSYRAYGARVGLESSWVSQLVRGRGSFGAHALRQLGLVDVRIVEQVEDAPVQSVQRMTREQVVVLIRRRVAECGTLRAYCARQGVHISTLSNMLGGRNRWTPRVLRLLGLEHVRIVARVDGAAVEPVPDAPKRPYRKMWRLGDWPSRYRVTEL